MTLKPRSALWRLLVAGVAGVLMYLAATNAIDNPVADTHQLTADFTDVSGLHEGSDVRIRGVQVGKVTTIRLERDAGRSIGVVNFSLVDRFRITSDTRVAIKYQALTGQRYIDVSAAAEATVVAAEVKHLSTTMTTPSFDITTLFNGLQPVLATLSPEEVNTFTENAAALLQGNGGGLGPMLDSIQKLTRFIADRQQVVSTLMSNLATVAQTLGGKSPQTVQILDWLQRPLDSALTVLDEFRKSDLYGPTFTSTVSQLLDNLGLVRGLDINGLLKTAFMSAADAVEALHNLPAVLNGLSVPPPAVDGSPLACTNGHAPLPLPVKILLNGQKVILCNPA